MPNLEVLERILDKHGAWSVVAFGVAFLLMCAGIALLGYVTHRTVTEHREKRRMAPAQDVAGHGGSPRLVLQREVERLGERVEEMVRTCARLQVAIRDEFDRRDRATAAAREEHRERLQRIEQLLDGVLRSALARGGGA